MGLSTVRGVLAYLIAIVVAVAVIPITDGSFARLAEVKFSRAWLLAVGLGLQIVLEVVELPRARFEDVGLAILLASYVCVLGFCASNLRTRGVVLIGFGIALNALVIALNLGMPYRVVDGIARETTVKHHPERASDSLTILSDRFAVGSLGAAISVGDLVMFAGIIELAYTGSRRARRRTPSPRTRYVDLPALEAEFRSEIDLREPQPDGIRLDETSRSRASRTRGS